MKDNVIIIPTRLEAKRLPNKPLKKINNKEMILHVYEAAKKANIGEVIVATPNDEICDLIKSHNGICIKTNNQHETGTDRVFEVFDKFLNRKPNFIINLQGDMPNIKSDAIKMLSDYINKNFCEIATLGGEFKNAKEISNLNNVKVLSKKPLLRNNFTKAIDFFREKKINDIKYIYHHIGIYAFTREALLRYVGLKRTKKEIERNLEQLRALDNNMEFHVGHTSSTPLSVDTEEDLENIRSIME